MHHSDRSEGQLDKYRPPDARPSRKFRTVEVPSWQRCESATVRVMDRRR
jgi:hypothetical protein